MRSVTLCVLLCGLPLGCVRPIRTDSQVSLTGPLNAMVTADVLPKRNQSPVEAMPVGRRHAVGPKIALVDVDGLLLNQNMTGPYSQGDNPVDAFREKLDAVAADPDVCAMVLRINSPGGGVTAVDIMWQELQRYRDQCHKPVVACLLDHGCSGAYYLATASDLIVAHPTTVTGGIGVVLNLFNMQDLMGMFNIASQSIKSGKNIDMGSLTASLPAESKKWLQDMADEFHHRFRVIVQRQRPAVDTSNETTFDGRIFTAHQALERKLIDRIGYLDDAVNEARRLANQGDAQLVLYHRPSDVARTPYAVTPNLPLQASLFPVNLPGVERCRLPSFLYLWQPDPTLVRVGGL